MTDVWAYMGKVNPQTGKPWTAEEAEADLADPSYAGFFVPSDGRSAQCWKAVAPWPEQTRWRMHLHMQMAMGAGVLELRNVR